MRLLENQMIEQNFRYKKVMGNMMKKSEEEREKMNEERERWKEDDERNVNYANNELMNLDRNILNNFTIKIN